MKVSRLCVGLVVGLGFAQLMAETPSPGRDINAVLAAHDRKLLELPAVVGVYVGVLADGKTPCCHKVMLARPTPETERKLPREIEVIRWSQKFLAKFARFVPETISGAARNFERRMRAREARSTVCDRRRDGLVMPHFFSHRLI
jgi:hypothetical protein